MLWTLPTRPADLRVLAEQVGASLAPVQAKIARIAPAHATAPIAICNVNISTRFNALHSCFAMRESRRTCWWQPSQMLAEESLKAPGNPSERVKDTDRWSASALNERKRDCGIRNQCVSRVFSEVRDAVASSSVL